MGICITHEEKDGKKDYFAKNNALGILKGQISLLFMKVSYGVKTT